MTITKFSEDHEWIRVEGGVGTVGITDFAQKALGDVVFVELPELGANVVKGDDVAVVESVKAASEIYAPVTGEILEVNNAIEDDPALVNQSPEDDGWFFKIRLADKGELQTLLDEDAYEALVKDQA